MTPLERAVRAAWREVLGGDEVGPDDRFTEAGGTSLHAIELAERLSAALGVEVPLLSALDHPTPARLAA
ncbi:MAG TPA: acyl carrier protein, partial [Candidatus Dormibacteraeota bacterium]|nr:acyl carrier protein [Candidatus Dormibacteraeota bacterium]